MLLSYGRDAKATWLRRLEGWQTDEDGNYIAQEKIGLICWQRQNIIYASRRPSQRYARSKSHPPKQLCLEKVLTTLGTEHPLDNVVTKHFTLAVEASTWMLCSPDKSLPKSSSAYWPMKPLMASGKRIPSTSHIWTCILSPGLWMDAHYWPSPGSRTLCKAYMLSSTMPYWSPLACTPAIGALGCLPTISCVAACFCPAWDLPSDDSCIVAYLSLRRLATVKASLRFARPLHATTTMIAYAQCDKLVVVDVTTHWPLTTACDVQLTTSGGPRERALGS